VGREILRTLFKRIVLAIVVHHSAYSVLELDDMQVDQQSHLQIEKPH